jgi:hypothetical protein
MVPHAILYCGWSFAIVRDITVYTVVVKVRCGVAGLGERYVGVGLRASVSSAKLSYGMILALITLQNGGCKICQPRTLMRDTKSDVVWRERLPKGRFPNTHYPVLLSSHQHLLWQRPFNLYNEWSEVSSFFKSCMNSMAFFVSALVIGV